MDNGNDRALHQNSSITLFESYIAIEEFITDTRLPFIDQYKLFDLLRKLLPKKDNQLTCQGFLSWFVQRTDLHKQQLKQTATNKRLYHEQMTLDNETSTKRFRRNKISHGIETSNDTSLVDYTQHKLGDNLRESSDIQQQLDRLQSVVVRLATNMDALSQRSNLHFFSPFSFESETKHEEGIVDNNDDDGDDDDNVNHEGEISDTNHRLQFPATTSTNQSYPIITKTIMHNGRNMMKHLRPRTTITSFARHVASDLFSREEIMAKLHVDHNNERDVLLRHYICTAWNLTHQDLYAIWPKIRNALLQLRRDAIAGKCIRVNKQHEEKSNYIQSNSEYEDDESLNKSKQMRLSWILNAAKTGRQVLVNCESQATGHRIMRIREKTQDKLEFLHVDPWIDQEVIYKETRKIKTLEKRKIREIHLSRLT